MTGVLEYAESVAGIGSGLDPCDPYLLADNSSDCGHRLASEQRVADFMTKLVESSYSDLPQAADVKKFDDLLDKTVKTLSDAGCYGPSTQPPNQLSSTPQDVCSSTSG